MKVQEIFDKALQMGIDNDPRGRAEIEKKLAKAREAYEDKKDKEKQEFDQDELTNPFSDSRILCGDPGAEVKTILTGIDIEAAEVLVADRLADKGKKVDLIIAHHPEGKALAALHEVMHMQEDILHKYGVPINVAEGIMSARINEVRRGLAPLNHNKAVDVAEIFDIPMMCLHTPADNMVTNHLQSLFDSKEPETLDAVITLLKEIPEYAEATKIKAGPFISLGSGDNRAGKVVVDMTGGTGGSEDAYAKLSQAGVGTLITMHIGEKHRKEAEKNHINIIVAGHIASDSLGMNLLLDEFEKEGVKVIPCSGVIRVKRF